MSAIDDRLLDDLALRMGKLIVKERRRLKMSQETLAERMGTSQNAITGWERAVGGHGSLHLRVMLGLERALSLPQGTFVARLGLVPEEPDFEAVVLKQPMSDAQKEALIGVYRAMLGQPS